MSAIEDKVYQLQMRLDALVSGSQGSGFGVPQQYQERPTDANRTSNTTLTPDPTLQIVCAANRHYLWLAHLHYDGPAGAGFKWSWLGPSGAAARYTSTYINASSVVTVDDLGQDGGIYVAATAGVGTYKSVRMSGIFQCGASGGNFVLNWAQNSSNATTSHLLTPSNVAAWLAS